MFPIIALITVVVVPLLVYLVGRVEGLKKSLRAEQDNSASWLVYYTQRAKECERIIQLYQESEAKQQAMAKSLFDIGVDLVNARAEISRAKSLAAIRTDVISTLQNQVEDARSSVEMAKATVIELEVVTRRNKELREECSVLREVNQRWMVEHRARQSAELAMKQRNHRERGARGRFKSKPAQQEQA